MYAQSVPSTFTMKDRTGEPSSVRGPYFATISGKVRGALAYHFAMCGRESHRYSDWKSEAASRRKAIVPTSAGLARRLAFDQLEQRLVVDRLGEMVIETRLARAPAVLFLAPAGDRHDQDGVAALGAQAPRDLVARQLGHADVEEHDVRIEIARRLEGLEPVVGDAHHVAAHLEQHAQALGGVRVVVDNEDAMRGGARRLHARGHGSADLGQQLLDAGGRLAHISAREQVRVVEHVVQVVEVTAHSVARLDRPVCE